MKDRIKKYASAFSEAGFWDKLKRFARTLGQKAVYTSLLLFFAYRRKETPCLAKTIIMGALGYLLIPLDAIPDLSPIVGFTDDIAVLSFALVIVAGLINKEVKQKAKDQMSNWFGEYDEVALEEVDAKL